ncbi:Multicopper oxidase [Olea europaea subsp. europaea]|uniref:Laccase n=1 Tax=Olea europaea subsp. europaea TaxID=158383 RepID=A0A8S0RCP0_OLEEU|nr:Multicopper oxidase [Olea europaea subsp. europaea]
MKVSLLHLIGFLLLGGVLPIHAALIRRHKFVLTDTPYTRLCSNKSILVVNGQFPGPTIYATEGDTIVVDVYNRARENVTIHWHGVKQPRYPWSDGPEFITQCPIQPGSKFSQKIILSDEIGTLWWHAHSDWSRATVHGAIIIYPKKKNNYPFPTPDAEVPIILGEWWKSDIQAVLTEFLNSGADPNSSDAFLINGQPGDLYPCSRLDTFKLTVEYGKTYLIRMINAVMNNIMFFSIANHNVTVVGSDASYTKPIISDYIVISPGQTIDFLLKANQKPSRYYMAAHAYASAAQYDNTTTTAIIEYKGNYTFPSSLLLPTLPIFNDTNASVSFTGRLRSLGNKDYPVDVPKNVTNMYLFTLSINSIPCANFSCDGSQNQRLLASVNNITFVQPSIAILQAYYQRIRNVFGDDFPSDPPFTYNYTAQFVPQALWRPRNGTEVRVLDYNSTVEIVFQGTNTVAGIDHPMHLHGQSFYVVGWGFGNFDRDRDPLNYNLVDPPLMNTIAVPINGWTTVRFKASNPVWLLHCHLERHISWGMEMAFITKDGKEKEAKMLPPPPDMPPC